MKSNSTLPQWWPRKIVSGGQTGVDRAALDWAIAHGVDHRGWCPRGRRAEDGLIPERYRLQETGSKHYRVRTKWNVRDSDATLVLNTGALDGGTLATVAFASELEKPYLVVQLDDTNSRPPPVVRAWLRSHRFSTLNVAGPRESKRPGIYASAIRGLNETADESGEQP